MVLGQLRARRHSGNGHRRRHRKNDEIQHRHARRNAETARQRRRTGRNSHTHGATEHTRDTGASRSHRSRAGDTPLVRGLRPSRRTYLLAGNIQCACRSEKHQRDLPHHNPARRNPKLQHPWPHALQCQQCHNRNKSDQTRL